MPSAASFFTQTHENIKTLVLSFPIKYWTRYGTAQWQQDQQHQKLRCQAVQTSKKKFLEISDPFTREQENELKLARNLRRTCAEIMNANAGMHS